MVLKLHFDKLYSSVVGLTFGGSIGGYRLSFSLSVGLEAVGFDAEFTGQICFDRSGTTFGEV
jgi:hypothetical protein